MIIAQWPSLVSTHLPTSWVSVLYPSFDNGDCKHDGTDTCSHNSNGRNSNNHEWIEIKKEENNNNGHINNHHEDIDFYDCYAGWKKGIGVGCYLCLLVARIILLLLLLLFSFTEKRIAATVLRRSLIACNDDNDVNNNDRKRSATISSNSEPRKKKLKKNEAIEWSYSSGYHPKRK